MPSTTQFKPLGVTGSSRGIGAAIALHLASLGSHVVINYVSSSSAAEVVAAKARDLGVKAITVQADVTKAEEIANLFRTANSEFGKLDIVMSNSEVEHFGHLSEVSGDDIDRVLAVDVKAQYFVAQLSEKFLEDNGRLILISSISAVMGIPNHALYAASKAAIIGMVRCLAWDFGKRNITVNCIAPGGVKTDMHAEAAAKYTPEGDKLSEAEIDERVNRMSPFGRPGFPSDIAGIFSSFG